MFQAKQVTIKGIAPIIMHNGRLADPLDPFSKELKRLNDNNKGKSKTDEKSAVISVVEWCGGLYHTDGTIEICDGLVKWDKAIQPHVPADLLKACIVGGAQKARLGKQAKAGVLVTEAGTLDYKGPKDVNTLMADSRFVIRKQARVQASRIMRTRPMFRDWQCTFTIEFDPEVMNWEQVFEALIQAGRYVGLGDWRPEHGRFEVAA
jgi:hypothetical protein